MGMPVMGVGTTASKPYVDLGNAALPFMGIPEASGQPVRTTYENGMMDE